MVNENINVSVVLVTFNRKDLLLKCLDAIKHQSYKVSTIYIVDNASTDETPEMLKKYNYILELPPIDISKPWEKVFKFNDINICYIRMNENQGGSGGFYTGMKKAYNDGCDWLWLMDDDGQPHHNCLENLLNFRKEADFLAPLVINIENKNELSFGIFDIVHNQKLKTLQDVQKNTKTKIYEGTANPFNGVLLSKKLIKNIGYPIKDMFIWGDEAEYLLRTKKKGFKILTIIDAIHYHPKQKKNTIKILNNKYELMYEENQLKYYCYLRNQAYRYKLYSKKALISSFLKYSWFFLVSRKIDLNGWIFYIKAYLDGINGNLTKHKKYLK